MLGAWAPLVMENVKESAENEGKFAATKMNIDTVALAMNLTVEGG